MYTLYSVHAQYTVLKYQEMPREVRQITRPRLPAVKFLHLNTKHHKRKSLRALTIKIKKPQKYSGPITLWLGYQLQMSHCESGLSRSIKIQGCVIYDFLKELKKKNMGKFRFNPPLNSVLLSNSYSDSFPSISLLPLSANSQVEDCKFRLRLWSSSSGSRTLIQI